MSGKELRPLNAGDVKEHTEGFKPEEVEYVLDYFEKTRHHPLHNLIMQCKREACEYKAKCPFAKLNKYPDYGEDCIVEQVLIRAWTDQLIQELDIDPENIVDQAQVREIVALTVFENRAFMGNLSSDPMVLEVVKNIAFDGTKIIERELHPLLKQLAENHKVKAKLREQLVATRDTKAKLGVGKKDNLLAKMDQMLEEKRKQLEEGKKD